MARAIQMSRIEIHHAPGETSRPIVHVESQIEQAIIEGEAHDTINSHEVNLGNDEGVQTHLSNEKLEKQRRN